MRRAALLFFLASLWLPAPSVAESFGVLLGSIRDYRVIQGPGDKINRIDLYLDTEDGTGEWTVTCLRARRNLGLCKPFVWNVGPIAASGRFVADKVLEPTALVAVPDTDAREYSHLCIRTTSPDQDELPFR